MPETGSTVSSGGIVVIYTDGDAEEEYSEVPDLTGYTIGDANYMLSSVGLNLVAIGASSNNYTSVVMTQSQPAGSRVPRGTVIELSFGVNDQSG